MKTASTIVLLSVFLLTACGTTPPSSVTEVPRAVKSATWTPKPTLTPRPVFTATKIPKITITPTISQSTSAFLTLAAPFPCKIYATSLISPNGEWAFCYDEQTRFVNRDGESLSFDFEEVLGREYYGQVFLAHWTRDSQFVYLYLRPEIDGPGPFLFDCEGLLRVDLNTHEIVQVLKFNAYAPHVYAATISPTSKRLAYIDFNRYPLELTIQDLSTGKTSILPIDERYSSAGRIYWSDDGLLLAYSLVITSDDYSRFYQSIKLFNLKDETTTTLIKDILVDNLHDPSGEYFIYKFNGSESITLVQDKNVWLYEIASGKLLSQGTATPTP